MYEMVKKTLTKICKMNKGMTMKKQETDLQNEKNTLYWLTEERRVYEMGEVHETKNSYNIFSSFL